ncbi:MAG TPA: hypothetical protein VFQ14_00455 [Thermoleophilaceae bacterium]|nr:hypothetical protein [Thermoleophilaceae bacterium]
MSGDAGRPARAAAAVAETWRRLNLEQRVAAVAATLVIVSTLGPFSFVEAAEVLAAGAVLVLLRMRAERRAFHLPLGDGTAIAAAGLWCAVLIATRIFDRPPGQTALALLCALLLAAAGVRERAKREADDLPDPAESPTAVLPREPTPAPPRPPSDG